MTTMAPMMYRIEYMICPPLLTGVQKPCHLRVTNGSR